MTKEQMTHPQEMVRASLLGLTDPLPQAVAVQLKCYAVLVDALIANGSLDRADFAARFGKMVADTPDDIRTDYFNFLMASVYSHVAGKKLQHINVEKLLKQ